MRFTTLWLTTIRLKSFKPKVHSVDVVVEKITSSFGSPPMLTDDSGAGVEGRRRSGASRRHYAMPIGGLGFCGVGLGHDEPWVLCLRPPLLLFIAQRVGGPPTMDRLGAPDQGAIQGERGPSRWAGPEINPTFSPLISSLLSRFVNTLHHKSVY
jgi:hypothetical protein